MDSQTIQQDKDQLIAELMRENERLNKKVKELTNLRQLDMAEAKYWRRRVGLMLGEG